jgi:hypothetical protein
MTPVAKSASKHTKKLPSSVRVLYLYAISQMPSRVAPHIEAQGIDGDAPIEAVRCEDYLCWISRVSKNDFADHLNDHMHDLEWLAGAGLRHQRAIAEISSHLATLPTRFGTIFGNESSLTKHVKERKQELRLAFQRVANADEFGIKIFATSQAEASPAVKPSSGSDYLKRKAEFLRPGSNAKLDEELREFISALTKLAVAACPGGKASAGQPGLLWHGSFLVRRSDRRKFDAALKKYASAWQAARRIDCSGPWPPYSFVGKHVS